MGVVGVWCDFDETAIDYERSSDIFIKMLPDNKPLFEWTRCRKFVETNWLGGPVGHVSSAAIEMKNVAKRIETLGMFELCFAADGLLAVTEGTWKATYPYFVLSLAVLLSVSSR